MDFLSGPLLVASSLSSLYIQYCSVHENCHEILLHAIKVVIWMVGVKYPH